MDAFSSMALEQVAVAPACLQRIDELARKRPRQRREVQLPFGGRSAMMAPSMTITGCTAAHDAYDAQMRQRISQLVSKSAAIDAFMDEHHGSNVADLECAAQSMMSELDAHHQRACTFGTLSDDQAEVARHVAAMHDFATHAVDRCDQMMAGLDDGAYSWGPMMNGCAHCASNIVDDHGMCMDHHSGM